MYLHFRDVACLCGEYYGVALAIPGEVVIPVHSELEYICPDSGQENCWTVDGRLAARSRSLRSNHVIARILLYFVADGEDEAIGDGGAPSLQEDTPVATTR